MEALLHFNLIQVFISQFSEALTGQATFVAGSDERLQRQGLLQEGALHG